MNNDITLVFATKHGQTAVYQPEDEYHPGNVANGEPWIHGSDQQTYQHADNASLYGIVGNNLTPKTTFS